MHRAGALAARAHRPNTFRRVVKAHELLKPDAEVQSKRRLAFAKAHVNQLWQADTMVGPYAQQGAGKVQAKLIAFLDDASRVVCHGEFSRPTPPSAPIFYDVSFGKLYDVNSALNTASSAAPSEHFAPMRITQSATRALTEP